MNDNAQPMENTKIYNVYMRAGLNWILSMMKLSESYFFLEKIGLTKFEAVSKKTKSTSHTNSLILT